MNNSIKGVSIILSFFIWITIMPSNVGQENSYEVHHALVNYFPFWVVFFGLVALYFHLAVLGAKISQQIEYKKQVQEVKLYGQIALWILGVMFVFAFLAFDRESNILLTFLGIFGVALSSLAFTFAFPVFLYLFFLVFPYVYIYIYAATVKSETAEVAKKHTKNKRPDDLIEDELANAMIAGLKTDQELKEIISSTKFAISFGVCALLILLTFYVGVQNHRVNIASAASGESSYKGPLDEDGIREGEYFINEFFKSVSLGKTIKQNFQEAVVLTEAFTSSDSADSTNAPYFDKALQHPLLDDNGDGVGTNLLSDQATGDGALSQNLIIGVSSITGNDPGDVQVTQVTGPVFLGLGTNSVSLLWATVDDNTRLRTIWVEVKPPLYNPLDQGGSEQVEMGLAKTNGECFPA